MILVVDNYDSFTYNLVQYLGELGEEVRVFRNDAVTVDEIRSLRPTMVLLSPGPCTPGEAGVSLAVVERLAGEIPIFGVCLGHQAIGQTLGGRVVRAAYPVHGKAWPIYHDGSGVFRGLPQGFRAARYHSLVLDPASLPPELVVTAWTAEGEVMGVRHRFLPLEGVQFHPESILTEHGYDLLRNFLRMPMNS